MFIWNKGDLNLKQEEAIYEENSVLLVACPGSGKTRTLTYKIAYELSRLESKKQYIIAITYTNNAADEIKERVELLGIDISQLWIGTIHAFCLQWILKPYSLYLDELKNGFRIINSHDSQELITELCFPYKAQRITYWDFGLMAMKDGIISVNNTWKHNTIEKIKDEYYEILTSNNQVDFEQILYYSYRLLDENPLIGSILSKIFPFILIDEYQDTKEIQYHIIAAILRQNKGKSKTLIVGDPNQSIYETLGGFPMPKEDIEALLEFALEEYELTENYRSSEKIINYFENYRVYPSSIIPEGVYKDYESTISFNEVVKKDSLVDEIVSLIIFNVQEEKISPNEICIVAPQWIHLAGLTRELIIRLPDFSFNGPGMVPFSRDIDNFWYKLSRIVLTEPAPNIYIRRLRWSREVLGELQDAGVDISGFTAKRFLKTCNSIEIKEKDGLSYLSIFFNLGFAPRQEKFVINK